MKKKRCLLFGYQMRNGEIIVIPEESELVQKIFLEYLKGKSLQQLADMAQKTSLFYRETSTEWNKNMIARILDNPKYAGDSRFPSIIDIETFHTVLSAREKKAPDPCGILFISRKMICCYCGSKLKRNSKNTPRIRWDCSECGNRFGPLSDMELIDSVEKKFLLLCRNPESTEPEQIPDNKVSMKVVRLTNEIDRSLNEREVDPDRVLSLILECAAERYNCCQISGSEPETMKIRELLENLDGDKFNPRMFSQIVEQVIPQSDGSVKFRLVNQKII